jgi:hypothetical protein
LYFPDHAHGFDALERGVRGLRSFEGEHGPDATFDRAVIGFDLVVRIFTCR